jgi:hypothetical protein
MKDYLEKIREYEDIIEKNKDLIVMPVNSISSNLQNVKEEEEEEPSLNRSDFSFGRVSEAGSDAKDRDKEKGEVKSGELEDMRLNIECYRASVEVLLE